jgi:20S proteasome alpha/beta subunit
MMAHKPRHPMPWLPWRKRMTLCIAAECRGHVIIGSDFRGEVGFTSAENQNKLAWIEQTWPVLIAGTVARAHDLVASINREFSATRKRKEQIDGTNISEILREAARKQKYQLAGDITARELGLRYSTFLKEGKVYLSDKAFEDIETSVRLEDLDCQLIVVFFDDGTPHIYTIDSDLSVDRADNFCCIGSGSDLANASLFYREHNADQMLKTSLYRVFEAHQLAKRAPGVGENFAISIFKQEKGGTIVWQRLKEPGFRRLDTRFRSLGPKRITRIKLNLTTDLEEFDRTDPPDSEEEEA